MQPLVVDGQPVKEIAGDSSGTLYAVTNKGLYQRTKPGATGWTKLSDETNLPHLVAAGNGLLLSGKQVTCSKGDPGTPLRVSQDNGKTWLPSPKVDGEELVAQPVRTSGNRLHAYNCASIYYSDDAGKTWQKANDLASSFDVSALATDANAQNLYYIGVSEGGSGVLNKAQPSSTGWSNPTPLLNFWGQGVLALSQTGTIYVGTATGVQFSTDGGKTWRSQNKGLESTILGFDPSQGGPPNATEEAKMSAGARVNAFAFSWDGRAIYLGGIDGFYIRDANGVWQRKALNGQNVTSLLSGPDAIYATTSNGVTMIVLPA